MSAILQGLNRAQKQAVISTKGPLLIIAGAGTGKTTVISRRIAYIIEQKLGKPSEILALTFTEKSASEMEERVDTLVPYGYVDTWISTFHAFGNRVLQDNALDLGLPPDFKVMGRPAQVLFFQQNLFALELDYYQPLANPSKFIEALIAFVSRCKDEDVNPRQYKNYVRGLKKTPKSKIQISRKEWEMEIKKQEELANMYEKYESLKEKAGLLDFGDQVSLTLKLFRKRPSILKKYRRQFKYILVDEYQDTNWAQNELVELLASPKNNFCVVADDDQSIYRFRGAAISNVLEFKKTYPRAKVVSLIENFRSGQGLLNSAYTLIQHNNPDRLETKENINKKLVSVKSKSLLPPEEIHAGTLSEETDTVAAKIKELTEKESLQYKDVAILVRANARAGQFLRALNMKGIPHKFVGSAGLYDQPEIRILIAFLNSLADSEDSLQLFTLATGEIYELPMDDAIALSSFAKRKGRSLHWIFRKTDEFEDDLEISSEGKTIVGNINGDLQTFREAARRESVGGLLLGFLKNKNYLSRLEKEQSVEAQIKIQNIARFFEKIREFSVSSNTDSLKAFVDWLEVMRSVGDDPATSEFDPETDAVNIMTIHSAKGLEFRAVFLVNLVSDQFPSRQRAEAIPLPDELIKETLPSGDFHMQEERRLFYVGMTRAKDKLYFTWSKDMGGKRTKKISPFVLEALDRSASGALLQKLDPLQKISQFSTTKNEKKFNKRTEPKITRLTQASVDDYRTCAYKYRYVHVLRLPILRHHAVVYGAALHEAVATFYRAKIVGKKFSLKSLFDVFENSWTSEGFLSPEHEEKRFAVGKKVLKDFWKREKGKKQKPKFIEKDFRFDVPTSKPDTGVLVRGRFDRVDKVGGKVKIIDFKSGEKKTKDAIDKAAKDSLQMKIYALAYYKNYKKIPDFVGIYDLESGHIGGYKPTRVLLSETEEMIKETAKSVRKNLKEDSFPANPKYFGRVPACNYCAYSSICCFSKAKN